MAQSFKVQLDKAIKQVENITLDTFRLSVNEAFISVVNNTPVDTGAARNSWFTNLGNSNGGEGARTVNASGQDSINAIYATTEKARLGDAILLYSNLPYIERLEDGWSDQGSGMVKLAVAEWPQTVARNSRGN